MFNADKVLNELLDWIDNQSQEDDHLRVLSGLMAITVGGLIGRTSTDLQDLRQRLKDAGEMAVLMAEQVFVRREEAA